MSKMQRCGYTIVSSIASREAKGFDVAEQDTSEVEEPEHFWLGSVKISEWTPST